MAPPLSKPQDYSGPSWRAEKKLRIQTALYDTTLAMMRSDGYEATTVERVTAEVGIAKGTFFNYFDNKESVLSHWYVSGSRAALATIITSRLPKAPLKQVEALVLTLAKFIQSEPILWMQKSINARSAQSILCAENTLDKDIQNAFTPLLKQAKQDGILPPKVGVKTLGMAIRNLLTGAAAHWAINGCEYDLTASLRAQLRVLLPHSK